MIFQNISKRIQIENVRVGWWQYQHVNLCERNLTLYIYKKKWSDLLINATPFSCHKSLFIWFFVLVYYYEIGHTIRYNCHRANKNINIEVSFQKQYSSTLYLKQLVNSYLCSLFHWIYIILLLFLFISNFKRKRDVIFADRK